MTHTKEVRMGPITSEDGHVTIHPHRFRLWWKLRALLTPGCWVTIARADKEWDRELVELMEEHDFRPRTVHTARIGGVVVWTANHPYHSFRKLGGGMSLDGPRPTRATMLQAGEKLKRDLGPEYLQ